MVLTRRSPGRIGASVRRLEDPRFLLGRARYLADLTLPGMVEAAFVRSPHAHARIRAIHLDPALGGPGVVGALTGLDAAGLHEPIRADSSLPGYKRSGYPALAAERVRYAGEPVAIVAARDRYQAEDAAERLAVEYEVLPAVASMERALAADAPLVHPEWGDNVFGRRAFSLGEVERAFGEADLVYRGTFRSQRVSGLTLEGRGCLARYDPASRQLTLWTSTQMPHLIRMAVAEAIHLPAHLVRVIAPDVGGGFGVKGHFFPEEIAVSLLAMKLGRPVKWIEDRREHLLASMHAREHLHEVEAAARRDGTILALRARILVDAGAYSLWPPTAVQEAAMASGVLPGPYKIRHYEVEATTVATNKCPLGTYRGVGRPMACFTIERTMDEIARRLGLDPVAVRQRNMVQPGEFPYTSVTGLIYDSGSFVESLDRLDELLDRPAFRQDQAAARRRGRYLGLGVSCYTEQTAHATAEFVKRGTPIVFGYESALVRVDQTGTVTVAASIQSHGQGLETTLAQIAAEHLSLPLEDVLVLHGDTGLTPIGMGTFASRSAVLAGGATLLAARKVRDKAIAIAAHLLEASVEDVRLEDSRFQVRGAPHRSVDWRAIARAAYIRPEQLPSGVEPGLEASHFYDPLPGTGAFANAAHAAVVEVDPETGSVRLLRYVVVEDCGTMINPMILDGQAHGGAAQGIGATMLEELLYDEQGQLLTASLMDYLIPSATDLPRMEVAHIETPSPGTIGGFKGTGEGGAIAPPAAIANAVADALAPLGVQVDRTPLSPPNVLEMIRRAEAHIES